MYKLESMSRNVRNHIIFCVIPVQLEITSQCTYQSGTVHFLLYSLFVCVFFLVQYRPVKKFVIVNRNTEAS